MEKSISAQISLKDKKDYYKHNLSGQYFEILNKIRKDFEEKEEPDYMKAPYIIMCAATLECRLNDEYIEYAFALLKNKSGALADYYVRKLSFKDKLDKLVPTLTDEKYIFNKENEIYNTLVRLIDLRNTLVHGKAFYTEVNIIPCTLLKTTYIPEDIGTYMNRAADLSFGITEQPQTFHEALEKLEDDFFGKCPTETPERLKAVALVKKKNSN